MNRRSLLLVCITVFVIILFNQQLIAEQYVSEPRLEPDPQALEFAASFDQSDWRSLFELAYWGSGAAGWESAADNLNPAVDQLLSETASMDDRLKAEAVLEFMHEHFLKSYRLPQSRLDILLTTGRYNCISSAVLYAILGTAAGLDIDGVSTFDHAFCSVKIGDQRVDIETTNPYGFDPGTRTEFQDDFGKVTGFAYVPPGNYRKRTSIDVMTLFSLLLQNRIADAEAAGRYADAVGLAVDRWTLLGGGRGADFEELIIRMLNYGALLSRAGREEDALSWVDRGITAYGSHPKWEDFVDGVANNLLIKLIQRGHLADARTRLDILKTRLTPATAAEMELMVTDSELLESLNNVKAGGADSEFLDRLKKAKQNGVLSNGRIREFEVNWRLYKIDLIAKSEGWSAAWRATETAILELGRGSQLDKALRIYRSNHKAELYNAVVEAYNIRNFDEALILVKAAVIEFPNEAIFRNLLIDIERTSASVE